MRTKTLITGLIAFVLAIVIGCSEKDQVKNNQINEIPKLTKTGYGGCFTGNEGYKSTIGTDTMYYELINDTLLLHIIVNRNCAAMPADSVVIHQEYVNIYLKDKYGPIAFCMCDFDFDYYFTDFVTLHAFYVYYKDYGAANYTLWGSLTFP
jgi:hypothetical protein